MEKRNSEAKSSTYMLGGRIWLNGKLLPKLPRGKDATVVWHVDGRLAVNGYEWKNGRWKRTIWAITKSLF